MKTRVLGALLALTLVAAPVWAQDHRVEIGFNGGYSLSEGVSVNADTVEGLLIDEVNPKSGSSWGLNLNVYASEQVQFGFLFGQQSSTLELKPSGAFQKFDVSDMKVNNYHGTFTYNFGYGDAPIRPFIFGGLRSDPLLTRGRHGFHDREQHPVLDHLGWRCEGLCQRQCRLQLHRALGADLHQLGPRRHLVQPLLAGCLLGAVGGQLLEPV